MDLTLFETKRRTDTRVLGVGFASLAAHAVAITAAVYGTLHAVSADTAVKLDTTAVLLTPEPRPAAPPPVQITEPLRGFQTITLPTEIPTGVLRIDLQERFDPRDYSGTGVEGGRANGAEPPADGVYSEALVEERPALLSAPPPHYPNLLRQARIQGRVLLRAIVDTTGRAEPGSIEVVTSPDPGFDASARDWLRQATFRPARSDGKAVRVRITIPLQYSVTSD